jgi:membrane-associated protein
VTLLALFDVQSFLESLGPWTLAAVLFIIFAECGLLIGFFLPGDSLLFITGLLVASGFIATPVWLVCVLVSIAAVLGNVVGYRIGARVGPPLFNRPESRFFRREYVDRTAHFFARFGSRALVLARFVPIVRTFITAMAGVGRMDFRAYLLWSAVGGVLWGTSVTLLGYYLGNVTFVKNNIELIAVAVVLLSVVPIWFELRRHQRGEQPADDPQT